ncbi:SDR family oxidoreductase [Nonomuraea wenchangensis]|uniref:SDR family NAD(P)-dependent oxidoreductase n=1 Tax=Nonomuraea wenchangensis TaxID=568860 RepID=UPI00344953DB
MVTGGRLSGRVALVTGAGSGIGAACALRLAAEGARVGVLDIRGEAAEETAAAVRDRGGGALALECDVSAEKQVAAAVASVSAFVGDGAHAAYGASKAALVGFARHVATMYGARGVRCNAVAPALVLTPAAEGALSPAQLADKAAERLLPWPCDVDDVANLVAFLACDESRCLTGQTLILDSGTLAHRPQHAIQRRREQRPR